MKHNFQLFPSLTPLNL